ncbi:MAG: hypothetical protein II955_05520, partial [Clostridia bacterium]|nr:hypothetical protein [Clostridia bacterium]
MGKTCAVCGKPSGIYPLCPACFKLRDEGKIQKCEKCEKWHLTTEPCDCAVEVEKPPKAKSIGLKCLTCDNEATPGFHFCTACWKKYKDKELYLKITNCSMVDNLGEDYTGKYTTDDGHVVKSQPEREIDNYLFKNKISHKYEKEVPYGPEKEQVITPDFYLEDKKIYIEYWGYGPENKKYRNIKKFKLPIYREKGLTVICVYQED